jgi:predicted nucleotidyltransferase
MESASARRTRIGFDSELLADFCRRHHIRRLAFFGSVLRDDFGPESDVDVLVEFEPGHVPGLAFFSLEQELARLLGRKVDLNTPGFLSPYFRDEVLSEAEVLYDAA